MNIYLLRKFGRKLQRRLKSYELNLRNLFDLATVKSLYGVHFNANYHDATFQMYIKAAYGFFYWNRITSISEDFIFLDIGANQGLYSICAARNSHCRLVYAFEPVPTIVELLHRNLGLNAVDRKCVVVDKAISDRSGEAEIRIHSTHSGVATISAANLSVGADQNITIQTLDAPVLDTIVTAGNLPLYVKIDVEGHEDVVLKELLRCAFADSIREIFYEVDEAWHNPQILQVILEDAGFCTKRIGSGKHYDVLATRF